MLVALSANVRLLRFYLRTGVVWEVWTCPAWGLDFERSGPVYRDFGRAIGAARRAALRFGQTLDIDTQEAS